MYKQLKSLWKNTIAESNVLVAIVTVVVATILIIIAAIKPTGYADGVDSLAPLPPQSAMLD